MLHKNEPIVSNMLPTGSVGAPEGVNPPPRHRHIEESVAVSRDARALQTNLVRLLSHHAARYWPSSDAAQISIDEDLPELPTNIWISVTYFISDEVPAAPPYNAWKQAFYEDAGGIQERVRIETQLRSAFETDPLEDGMDHPAEHIIAEALQSNQHEAALAWLKEFSLNAEQPSFAASVLRCLGRVNHIGTALWRTELVRQGLAADNVEIRDAAAQAAESWDDSKMLHVLETHSDTEPWLQAYIQDIIEHLRE